MISAVSRLRIILIVAISLALFNCSKISSETEEEETKFKLSPGTYELSDSIGEMGAKHFVTILTDTTALIMSYKSSLGDCWLRESTFDYTTDDSSFLVSNVNTKIRHHCDSSWSESSSSFLLNLNLPILEVQEDSFAYTDVINNEIVNIQAVKIDSGKLLGITKEISRQAYNWPDIDDEVLFPQEADTLIGDSVEFRWKFKNEELAHFDPQLFVGTNNPPVNSYILETPFDSTRRVIPGNQGFIEGTPYFWYIQTYFLDSLVKSTVKMFYVKPFPDKNANLKDITLMENSIEEQFYTSDNSFYAEVPSEIDSVHFLVEAREAEATILINGDTVTNGKSKALIVGLRSNTFVLTVISKDGNVQKNHNLSVFKIPFKPPRLSKLEFEPLSLVPKFHPDREYYDLVIPVGTDSITYTAVPEDTNTIVNSRLSTVRVFGINLNNGLSGTVTKLTIGLSLVQKYETILKNYNLDLVYLDTRLKSLGVSSDGNDLTFNQTFIPETKSYTLNLKSDTQSLNIQMETFVPGHFILINGQTADHFQSPTGPITYSKQLSISKNVPQLKIEVNAAKNYKSETYTIELIWN